MHKVGHGEVHHAMMAPKDAGEQLLDNLLDFAADTRRGCGAGALDQILDHAAASAARKRGAEPARRPSAGPGGNHIFGDPRGPVSTVFA